MHVPLKGIPLGEWRDLSSEELNILFDKLEKSKSEITLGVGFGKKTTANPIKGGSYINYPFFYLEYGYALYQYQEYASITAGFITGYRSSKYGFNDGTGSYTLSSKDYVMALRSAAHVDFIKQYIPKIDVYAGGMLGFKVTKSYNDYVFVLSKNTFQYYRIIGLYGGIRKVVSSKLSVFVEYNTDVYRYRAGINLTM
jgi:hypothetical protein